MSLNVTLDGCCDHNEAIPDEELHVYASNLLDEVDALLFGRVTYLMFEEAWPPIAASGAESPATVEFARKLQAKRKYVFSHTLPGVTWENAVLLRGDLGEEVRRLKAEDGRALATAASPTLTTALARLDLIDEYRLVVQPIVAGHGPWLLEGLGRRLALRRVESRPFQSGAVLVRYIPATC